MTSSPTGSTEARERTEASDAFLVVPADGSFEVRRDTGRVVMVCGDAGSARHYAVLLNEAYRTGYRQGYRAARRGAER